jgi:hypothetical protein
MRAIGPEDDAAPVLQFESDHVAYQLMSARVLRLKNTPPIPRTLAI